MIKKLGSMPFSDEYLAEETVGHWVIENDPGKEARMYCDEIMLGLIGLTKPLSPEETFKAWINGIDEKYMDSVLETERMNVNGVRAEVVYPWHYPDGHTILVRCEGIRNYAYKDGIRTEGRHRNISDLTRLQTETAVIAALAGDFESVDYVVLKEHKENDVAISFRTSERLKAFVPDWDKEMNFHNRLEMLVNVAGYNEDVRTFRAQTRREIIIQHLEKEPAYYVNSRAVNEKGLVEYFQMKFTADRRGDGKLVGIVVGIHSIDSELRQEFELREKVTKLVDDKTEELRIKNASLSKVNNSIIEMMGIIVESRDEDCGNHINRVKYLTRILATQVMKDLPEYGLTAEDVNDITGLSPLHDIGKIRIPDSILLKKGKLTKEEFEVMKTHCDEGCAVLKGMSGSWNPKMVKLSLDICRYHHEKWDGRGYPCGLKGDEIPIAAQIVSIADIYDALVSERCYKPAFTHDKAYAMIMNGECGAFSGKLLNCFKKCKKAFGDNTAYLEDTTESDERAELASVTGAEYISDAVPLLEKISESMPGGFFIYEAEGDEKFIYFNDMMVDLLGCSSREDFIKYTGNSFKGLVHPDDYAEIAGDISRQIKKDNLDHIVYRVKRKDGSVRWLDDYGKYIQSGDLGNVFFVFVVDFTETYMRRDISTIDRERRKITSHEGVKGALRDLKVLVVDDSDMARELNCELLEEEGAVITEATNGLQAVEAIKKSMDYDLILMDLVMPVMSGVSAIREIRRLLEEAGRYITIICLTAEGSDMQIKEALDAGAYECMYKPLRIPELSGYVLAAIRENTLKMEQKLSETVEMANTDILTKVKNIVAFTDKVSGLAFELKENPDLRFAVVMCDCDDLKYVNDSYGHSVGNEYIRNTSSAICETFRNSPVYRIGGDEFVVILEGEDYEQADTLFEKLKGHSVRSNDLLLIRAGKACYSAGIAYYDPATDKNVSDVIKRADAEMYREKRSK